MCICGSEIIGSFESEDNSFLTCGGDNLFVFDIKIESFSHTFVTGNPPKFWMQLVFEMFKLFDNPPENLFCFSCGDLYACREDDTNI